jgi:hypothetical protein
VLKLDRETQVSKLIVVAVAYKADSIYSFDSFQEKSIKKPCQLKVDRVIKFGSDILSRFDPVPSAQAGLTSLFGMGRGGPRRYSHQKTLNILVFL